MPSPAATPGHHSSRRRLPGVTILALCMLTAGWIAFAVLAPSPDYTDFESQATHLDLAAGRGDANDAGRESGAAPPPTLLHRVGLAGGTGKQKPGLAVDSSTADDEALAFTVQHNMPSSNAFSLASPPSSRDSLTNKLRIKLDRTATLLGDLLLGLFGIDDGAEWFSEGDFDYETSQSGLDGGTLSSWSESSVYVERTNSLHPSRPSSFGSHILDEPLRGYLYPVEYASATDAYACSSTAVAPVPVTPAAPWIALIQRGKCPFSEKVRFAQRHGAEAVVFGDQSESEGGIAGGHGLLTPWSPENTDDIKIPSTFVSRASYLSLIKTWKDEQDIVKQMRDSPPPPPPMQDGSTQTSISPRDAATEYVGLEVVLSKDEMLASPFLDLLFVLLFLPSLLTLVTVFVQRIRLARAAQAERAPKDAVARLPVFRWGDHVVSPPPPSSGGGATSAVGTSSSSAGPVAAPEKPTGRPAPLDEEREIGVEAGRAPMSPPRRVSISNEDVSEPDEATTLLPHSSSSAPLARSSSSASSSASAPSLAQRAFARLPFVVQRFLPSFIRPPVPATPASARSSRLNNAVPTRRFPSIVECPFCLCDFENGDTVMELPCGHLFHDEEVRGWLEGQKGVCPVCRTSVLNPAPVSSTPPATVPAAASVTLDDPTGGGGGSPRASSTRTDTTLRPTPTTSTDSSSRAPITAVTPIASTSSVRIDEGGGRPRSLVQRFESLLRPFPATPSGDEQRSSTSALHEVGHVPPGGYGARGPRSAESWRREELRKLCGEGIPDDPKHLRAAAYRFLLNLDEPDALVEQYRAFLDHVNSQLSALPSPPAGPTEPLRNQDRLLREIQRDVERTFGALAWFGAEEETAQDALWERLDLLLPAVQREGETEQAPQDAAPAGSSTPTHSTSRNGRVRSRRQLVLRPLYLYAYLNPGVSFVQGMSYIAAVFFYVFAQSSPDKTAPAESSATSTPFEEAEASTFFALSALLSQLRDLFVPALDGLGAGDDDDRVATSTNLTGLGSALGRFRALLLVIDSTAADALDRKGVDLNGLVVRWLTTLFANEFPLPDVMRVWDRILSFYPLAGEQQTAEALSPVLGHLIDLALAVIEIERSTIISPFAKAPKILSTLQDLRIEGDDIDKLLGSAWDIRERRLGRSKRQSVASTPTKSAAGLGRMFGWSPSSSARALPSSASDFEIDDRSSVAGSDASKPSGYRFGSLAFSSPRSSQAELADNVTVIDGKVLPPPPARVDQHVTIASLIEEELRETEQQATAEPDYGIEDDEDGANEGPALHRRMASGWGGLKASLSRLAASDTAAELSKRATNLQIAAVQSASSASTRLQTSDAAAALSRAQTNAAIKAQLLRDQLAEQAPERLARLKEAAAGATGRLVASTDSDRSGLQQPGSPREAPFVPPTMAGDRDVTPLGSPRSESADMARAASGGGPKPLLLSGSARRAQNGSEDFGSQDRGGPPSFTRSSSSSPTLTRGDKLLSPDFAVPPLSRSPSRGGSAAHARSASNWDNTPTRTTASTFPHPRSSFAGPSTAMSALEDQDSPIVSRRLQDHANTLRRGGGGGGPTSRLREDESPSPALVRTTGGRKGYQLSDGPVIANGGGLEELAALELGFDPSTFSQSFDAPAPAAAAVSRPFLDDGLEAEAPFVPPSGASEVAKPTTIRPTPARGSSLSGSTGAPPSSNANGEAASAIPPRLSSLGTAPSGSVEESAERPPPDEDSSLAANPSLSRSKVVRRPVSSRKRSSRASTSLSTTSGASLDLTGGAGEGRRVASEFLTRSTSGSSSSNDTHHRRRASEMLDTVAGRESRGDDDDEEDLLDAYAGDDNAETPSVRS